jgi:hypothetical protein
MSDKKDVGAITAEQMHGDLVRELHEARKLRNFNAKQWVDQKTDMFNEYLR